jgi:hypothetical protein
MSMGNLPSSLSSSATIFTCDQVFSATLEQEFESHLIHCLSLAITSFSAQCKLTRAETKQSELNAAHAQ